MDERVSMSEARHKIESCMRANGALKRIAESAPQGADLTSWRYK